MFLRVHGSGTEVAVHTIDMYAECYANVGSIDDIKGLECIQRHFVLTATCEAAAGGRSVFTITEPANTCFIVHGILPERPGWHRWDGNELFEVILEWLERSINWLETECYAVDCRGVHAPRIEEQCQPERAA